MKRPESLEKEFGGKWLFRCGVGVHLIEGSPVARPARIDPRSDHVSFHCDSVQEVECALRQHGIDFVTDVVVEGPVVVEQVFFHDPDNNMVEICNCNILPHHPEGGAGACLRTVN